MFALNYSQFRKNMKTYLDRVTDDYDTLVITRKENRNVVIMSEDAYNNMVENLFIMSDTDNYLSLLESIKELKRGEVVTRDVVEGGE
jgi:antitoxin YefM